jgi:hypothetical protein
VLVDELSHSLHPAAASSGIFKDGRIKAKPTIPRLAVVDCVYQPSTTPIAWEGDLVCLELLTNLSFARGKQSFDCPTSGRVTTFVYVLPVYRSGFSPGSGCTRLTATVNQFTDFSTDDRSADFARLHVLTGR